MYRLLQTSASRRKMSNGALLMMQEMPDIRKVSHARNGRVEVEWSDGVVSSFPNIYLRDNHVSEKTHNGERAIETHTWTNQQLGIRALEIEKNGKDTPSSKVQIVWEDDTKQSFCSQWLYRNSCNPVHRMKRKEKAAQARTPWYSHEFTLEYTAQYDTISEQRFDVYEQLHRYGACLIGGAPTEEVYDENGNAGVVQCANKLGRLMPTFWGNHFDVRSKPDANDLAYTPHSIAPHTDGPFLGPVPGIQFFHCISQASGAEDDGMSQLVDGFRIALDIQRDHPEEFELLSTIARPSVQYDRQLGEFRNQAHPVITVDKDGYIKRTIWSHRYAGCLDWDIDEDLIEPYYEAWKLWSKMVRDEKYVYNFTLKPGDIWLTDNLRCFHGRNSFGEGSGRHLQGCYISHDMIEASLNGQKLLRLCPKEQYF